ncbi:hypothetical protein KFU94_56670 [Chloroflexi bacterium TSY]|nr:hypothetical protein [Chloroflexi bacterium TSY]
MSTVIAMFMTESEAQSERETIQSYYGKYPAIVVENTVREDLENYGAHRGELLVSVPGILEETSDGEGQQPIEVWAKPCFVPGFFFIPEVDAPVWVEFIAGDINQPVWTGVWYPQDGTPVTVEEENPTEFQKIMRTASGHVVVLDDTEDAETITIHHKSGTYITIDPDGHITLEHKDGMVYEMAADKIVAITCEKLNITADVTVDGTMHIKKETNIDGALTVGTGPSTTIEGNEITGG